VPAGVAVLAVNTSDPEGFVSDATYFSGRPLGRPLTASSAVSLVEVMLIGTMTCDPSCGTTTVEMGSDTVLGTCTIMEPPPQLHPDAANPNPRKATPRPKPVDRNMECMRRRRPRVGESGYRRYRWIAAKFLIRDLAVRHEFLPGVATNTKVEWPIGNGLEMIRQMFCFVSLVNQQVNL
jgi:hypothetical protein